MNRDIIEKLAIDSAAGELNEDAETLFRSYLAKNPQAQQWAAAIRLFYDKTELAIKTRTALAGEGKAVPGRSCASRVRWLLLARWAAAVVLGALIGFTAGHWEVIDNTHTIAFQESSRDLKPVETVSDLKERYAGTFWGDKMLAFLEHKPGQQREANLPGIRSWDAYRQYMKEKNHE